MNKEPSSQKQAMATANKRGGVFGMAYLIS